MVKMYLQGKFLSLKQRAVMIRMALIDALGGSDVYADLDADGTVNVSDLLMLINAWGPCP
jgi:hypothetical protein